MLVARVLRPVADVLGRPRELLAKPRGAMRWRGARVTAAMAWVTPFPACCTGPHPVAVPQPIEDRPSSRRSQRRGLTVGISPTVARWCGAPCHDHHLPTPVAYPNVARSRQGVPIGFGAPD